MDTMWRNTTVKSSLTITLGSSLLLGIALVPTAGQSQAATSAAPGTGATSPITAAGAGSSLGKSGSGGGSAPAILPRDFAQLRIEPGDLLSVNVYDAPEFTDTYRVDPAGDLAIPLCGKVKVEGLTASEAAKILEATFRDGQILNRPQV